LAPPDDDGHECAFRTYAAALEREAEEQKTKLDDALARIATLEKLFARRSEKRGKKMPSVPTPPASPDKARETRDARALLRATKMATTTETKPVPDDLKRCPHCDDRAFRKVGAGKSCEVYSFVPGHFRRRVTQRETLGCRCGSTIVTAPAPARWSENTRYDSSFVAYLVTNKCLTSTPHHRFERQLTQTGIPIARSTINDLFRRAAQKLAPLAMVLTTAVRSDPIVYVDETTFKLTTKTSKAYLWTFVGAALTLYRFDPSRSGDVPLDVLGASSGVIVCDDYRGYDPLARKGARRRCGCLAHARRKWFEAGDVPEASEALALISAIYAVEHEAARRDAVGSPEHLTLRRSVSRAFFVELLRLARDVRRAHGPKSLLGRAAAYTWRNMATLGGFLRDPKVRPDNNLAERALRVVALGRKNFLFVHSEDAGRELALLYSLVTSCSRNDVNPLEYLADVLDRIDITEPDALRELLPDRWRPHPRGPDGSLLFEE
jgi:transposase